MLPLRRLILAPSDRYSGWMAHRLHRFHPLATVHEYQPLRYLDVLLIAPGALHSDASWTCRLIV